MTNYGVTGAELFIGQVAARLRARAAQGNVKQTELADATGISQSQVSKILRGERTPDLKQLWDLCYALGLDVATVVRESDEYVRDRSFDPPMELLTEEGDRALPADVYALAARRAPRGRAALDAAADAVGEESQDV